MVQNPKVYKGTNTISDPSAFRAHTPFQTPCSSTVVESIILLHIDTIYQAYGSLYSSNMQPIRPIFRDRSPQCSTDPLTWEAIPGFRCAKVGSLGDTAPGSLGSLPLGTWPPQGDPGGIKTYGKPMGKHMGKHRKTDGTPMENLWEIDGKTEGKPVGNL